MSNQWVIQDGNVLWRQELTLKERSDIVLFLLKDGMTKQEADLELAKEQGKFMRCNENQTHPLKECLEYVVSYSKKGDVIIINNTPYIFMEQADG
jgi:S-adenosylmethionine:tRNA-ribosyltransferase-isomerase (queuine synthetase)